MAQTFGALLRILRRRHGMTQSDLALKLGYSRSLVAALELNQRLPDVDDVAHGYVAALGLLESRELAAQLVELAALARNERPPASSTHQHRQHPATAAGEARRSHQIPIAPTQLLGRDLEVNLVCDRFLELNARLLTLVGPPGVGKTRLAQAVASRLEAFYTDGAYFVPLAAVTNPEFVIPDLLTKLGVQDGSSRPA